MKVIIFSRYFPAYHPKKGEPTFFVEKVLRNFWKEPKWVSKEVQDAVKKYTDIVGRIANVNHFSAKGHTIRAGKRWKVGDMFSPRIWSGKPYASKQIEFAPPIEVKKVWDVIIERGIEFRDDMQITVCEPQYNFKPNFRKYISDSGNILIAKNDGLSVDDFNSWFNKDVFEGQIICWDEKVNY